MPQPGLDKSEKLAHIKRVLDNFPSALTTAPDGSVNVLYAEATSEETRQLLLMERTRLEQSIMAIDEILGGIQ